jgi:hypothetical protein
LCFTFIEIAGYRIVVTTFWNGDSEHLKLATLSELSILAVAASPYEFLIDGLLDPNI